MKIMYKVLLANAALSVLIALIFGLSQQSVNVNDFVVMFGLSCMGVAVVDLFISIILFLAGKENYEWGRGFLLSCGLLLLVGFALCTSAFQGLNYH